MQKLRRVLGMIMAGMLLFIVVASDDRRVDFFGFFGW